MFFRIKLILILKSKKMNLSKLNVQELSTKEMITVEGGILIIVAVVYLASTSYGLANGQKYKSQPH